MKDVPLSGRVLGEIYGIDVEAETAVRIDRALTATVSKMLDIFAMEPALLDGFSTGAGDEPDG
ncbi:hypothetical protein [Nitratireductor soli]|uniref:hypothetical protein n=1 Tax=Nitratireductor soli TaxID=1670619 RepID=UPI00065E6960|nr:hypothetical protein [Nitratireductor soli]